MRTRALVLVLGLALAGCRGAADPDGGWCCNRPRPVPCHGCASLIDDPITFGNTCPPRLCCEPALPGRHVLTVRYHEHALPEAGCVRRLPPGAAVPRAEPVIVAPPPRPPVAPAPVVVPEPAPVPRSPSEGVEPGRDVGDPEDPPEPR